MDLDEAIDILKRPAQVRGVSDLGTITAIEATKDYVAPDKLLTVVPALDGVAWIRPVDALLGLAYATRMRGLHPDIHSMYKQWAWIRYLGLFDNDGADLVLSAEATNIRGNQRRVASEELGIGFAKIVAEKWLLDAFGAGVVTLVDIDVVPDGGTVPIAAGGRHVVQSVSNRRPDYFLVHVDPRTSRSRVRVLECKGTLDYNNQVKQLASAVHQLGGVEINAAIPPGLAVSTVFADSGQVRYIAVDPGSDDPTYNLRRLRSAESSDRRRTSGRSTAGSPDLPQANGVVEATWAQLADYAGATDAAIAWAPNHMRRRLSGRLIEATREIATPIGECIGRRAVFGFGRRTIEVFAGVTQEIHAGLVSVDLDEMLLSQAALADRTEERKYAAAQTGDDEVLAVGGDGTVLNVRIVN